MIHVVIVNYRTADLTIACLRSLMMPGELLAGSRVSVTDCASADESVQKLQAAVAEHQWGPTVTIVPLEKNGGFAYGNNAILRTASEPYVLLLNPDTYIRPGAIQALVELMEQNPKAGIAGSRLEDPDGTPQRSAFRFPSILGEFEGRARTGPISRVLARWVVAPPVPEQAESVEWVAGASMLIRAEVLQGLGFMDEGFFMYYEEVDFCRRAAAAGWETWYVPSSRVVHLVGQASGVTDTKRPARRLPRYWFESRQRYFAKHHGRIYAWLADAAFIAGHSIWQCRSWVNRKRSTGVPMLLRDVLRQSLKPIKAL